MNAAFHDEKEFAALSHERERRTPAKQDMEPHCTFHKAE
jgi:hypothetical protein